MRSTTTSRTSSRSTTRSGRPIGRALIPFPPLPALVLLPFVAVFGLTTDAALIATVLGALVVGLAFQVSVACPYRRESGC